MIPDSYHRVWSYDYYLVYHRVNISVYIDVYRCIDEYRCLISLYVDVYRSISYVYIGIYREYISVYNDVYRCMSMNIGVVYRCMSLYIDVYRCIDIYIGCISCAYIDIFRSIYWCMAVVHICGVIIGCGLGWNQSNENGKKLVSKQKYIHWGGWGGSLPIGITIPPADNSQLNHPSFTCVHLPLHSIDNVSVWRYRSNIA